MNFANKFFRVDECFSRYRATRIHYFHKIHIHSFSLFFLKKCKAMGLSKLKAYHTLSPCRFASYINDSVSRKLALLRLTPFTTIMFILLTFMSTIYFHFYLHFKHIISLKGGFPFIYIIIYTYNLEFGRKISEV